MTRIAIAGFQHETNSFGIGQAGLPEFEMADSWPGLLQGQQVISGTLGMNLPIAGFAEAATQGGATLLPILWCAAEPSGPVTDDAFDTIAQRIVDGVIHAMPLDGIYLDLHGAMITQSHDDGEAALLKMLRSAVGPDLPIAVSLDMHANVSPDLVALTDVLCIYRTYPHLDMGETGARAWHRLQPRLRGQRPAKAFLQSPYLIPLHAQHTGADPARSLYRALADAPESHVEMALGFTAGDTFHCGPSIVAYAPTSQEATRLATAAQDRLIAARYELDTALIDPEAAVIQAMADPDGRPAILADVQDNPGAGASSDTTGLLRALIACGAQRALLGLMHDPALAAKAHAAGQGTEFSAAMGGRSGLASDQPFPGRFRVEALSEGHVRYTGAMYGGGIGTLGPSCVLRVLDTGADVQVVVTSIRNQCLDLAQFTHFGLEPAKANIICVKSTAHFRADFAPIARTMIPVAAPGLFPCDLSEVPYSRLREGVAV